MVPKVDRMMARKSVRFVRGLFVAMACVCLTLADALAAAPQLKTRAPGFYRLMLGDFEITALSDGVFELNTKEILTHSTPKSNDLLARSFHGNVVTTSVNAYLVNTAERLILVDTGVAKLFGPTLGKLPVNLAASGYRPEHAGIALITHMHPDHIGGLVADGRSAFPNATVYADQRDTDFWLSAAELQKAPAARKGFFQGAAAAIGPTSVSVWGDPTEIASARFAESGVTMGFDSDAPESARKRVEG
jgi:glyoxylase-like metal-dependent hydrolase (beta-lactamase superfamily II)